MVTPLQWRTEERVVDTLLPHKKSPRKITKEQAERLKQSLEHYNLVEIPAIDLDGTILAGHQRIRMLQLLGRGKDKIDVRVPNRKLTPEESDRYLIASNAIDGEWDWPALIENFNVSLLVDLGFEEKTLDEIWDRFFEENKYDEKKELAKIKTPYTKPGDIILLGRNRLICGDSTDPETLKKLFFNGEQASMIMSDPIYNIAVDYNKGIGGKQSYGGTVDDNKTDEEYKAFLKASMEAALAVTKDDAHVFYWSDETYIWLIQTLYRELGITNKRVCLWLKNGQNPTPSVAFNKCYEPCTYGVRGKPHITKGVNKLNEVMNEETTTGNLLLEQAQSILSVWTEARLGGEKYEHSTMKPPSLYYKAIRRCTQMGDIILDSFSGSGSTIMAGEQLNRPVYAVEIEPVFCDLAIRRYELLVDANVQVIRDGKKDILTPMLSKDNEASPQGNTVS